MKRMLGVVAGVALAGAMFTSVAEAQGAGAARAVQFGLGGGLTMPTGDAGDVFKMGYHGQASMAFNPGLPFGLRVDAMYHSMDGDGFDGSARVIAGVVNGLFNFGTPGGQVQPYASVGLGMYNLRGEITIEGEELSDSETKVGVNGGLGLRFNLSGLSTFVESRYHHITTSGSATQLIPVTFGVMLGR